MRKYFFLRVMERSFNIFSIFSVLLSLKIPFTKVQDDVQRGYSLPNARSIKEFQRFRLFNDGLDPIIVFALVIAKDDGSMSRIEYLNETVNIIDYVGENFAIKNITYNDICKNFCDANEAVRQFRNGMILNENAENFNTYDFINASFPIMHLLGRGLDLTPSFFGVQTYDPSEMKNSTTTNIKDLKVIVLQFRAQQPPQWTFKAKCTEINISIVKVMVFTMTFTQDEVVRTGMTLAPFISFGFVIMLIFSVTTVYINTIYIKQWSFYKAFYAIFGCICPLFATSAAIGLLFFLGLRFGSILFVTPFLILAIGVDDAFLMMNAWNRILAYQVEHRLNFEIRDMIVLIDVGPSITITSLTNMLTFGIGACISIPEIQILCIAIATAILFDYIYTITVYTSIMTIGGIYEIRQKNFEIYREEKKKNKVSIFFDSYCEWLSSGFTSLFLFIIIIIYWIISIRGALSAKAGLTPEKLFLSDSPLIEMNAIRDKYVLPAYTFVNIFVNNPGNLNDPKRVSIIKEMISEFEAMPECNGAEFSHFWIRDYEAYLTNEKLEDDFFKSSVAYSIEDLQTFFNWPEYQHWGGFVRLNYTEKSFFATVAFHGENQADWIQKLHILKKWRNIVDSYTDLDASIYNDEAFFTEQFETLIPTMIQTSLIVLVSMAVACWIFMVNICNVIVAVAAIISICIGVFGLLSLWQIDVDPISMATMIMGIGLAVDFPAHITFHYYRSGFDKRYSTAKERIAHSLITIGFPLLQCSGSTIFFTTCLLLIPCYMSEVFVKSIVLVISLGTIHALVIVPALLCSLSNIYQNLISPNDNKVFFHRNQLFSNFLFYLSLFTMP
ncbi:unnamed protein product [Dracunculus medinensis]|uniref:SSD domain-containing protein n=1 Tax=Dracunculus medinensis TaxID=318479 RepID=A0A3P7SPH9_DRAME|nr:unnamed protein product [Dracunculus medinensis]